MKKKEPKISTMPQGVTFNVLAFICYSCDQYFWVDRGFPVHKIKCPVIRCQDKARREIECIGHGEISFKISK